MSNKGRGLGGKLTGFYVPELGILFLPQKYFVICYLCINSCARLFSEKFLHQEMSKVKEWDILENIIILILKMQIKIPFDFFEKN